MEDRLHSDNNNEFHEKDVENQIKRIVYNAKKSFAIISNTFDSAMSELSREDYMIRDSGSSYALNLKRFERDSIIEGVAHKIANPDGLASTTTVNGIEVIRLINKTVESMKMQAQGLESSKEIGKMTSNLEKQVFVNHLYKESQSMLDSWLTQYRSSIHYSKWPTDFSKYSDQLKTELDEYFKTAATLTPDEINAVINEIDTKNIDDFLTQTSIMTSLNKRESGSDESRRLRTSSFIHNATFDKILDRLDLPETEKNQYSAALKEKLLEYYQKRMKRRYYSYDISADERDKFLKDFKSELGIKDGMNKEMGAE